MLGVVLGQQVFVSAGFELEGGEEGRRGDERVEEGERWQVVGVEAESSEIPTWCPR